MFAEAYGPVIVVTPDQLTAEPAQLVRIPFAGRLASAGFPSPADDFAEDAVDLPRWMCPSPAASFLWRIAGTSMIDVGIHDGDLAVVDRSLEPIHGDVVIATIDGDPTLKHYLAERGGRPRLAFANADMPAFEVSGGTDAAIWGVVTIALRLFRPLARA